jgi:hypothetical protein
MGEITEMMLDGTLCGGCGVVMPGEAPGYPRRCQTCKRLDAQPAPSEKVTCKTCGRRVKFTGLKDHMRDAHQA